MGFRTIIENMSDLLTDPEIIRKPAFEILSGVVVVIYHIEFLYLGVLLFFHGLYRALK